LYFRNGIYSKAAKYYRMGLALETEFNEDALHGFGSALAMNDRTDDAIKVYKLLVRQRPGNRLYSANLEALYNKKGEKPGSRKSGGNPSGK
ncbi:hypothetical protein MNBD_NITROSPINAE03-1534, partial [hydrothermal vent metagenome]